MDDRPHVVLARVERDEHTGDVMLHLIEDSTMVQLTEGAEYLTLALRCNPFEVPS